MLPPRTSPSGRRKPRFSLTWLFVSLFVSATVFVPLAQWAMPHVVRYQYLERLTAEDLDERARGLNYVIRHAGEDPRVARGAAKRLSVADDMNFVQIASALDRAGQWRLELVGADAWLRWIGLLARDASDPAAPITAAAQLADSVALLGDPHVARLLGSLMAHDDAEVRLNALVAAAQLAGAAAERGGAGPVASQYLAIIAAATRDAHAQVARHAWQFYGMLGSDEGAGAADLTKWRDAPAPVAMAMLWAAVTLAPEDATPVLALRDAGDAVPDALRAMWPYFASLSTAPEAKAALMAAATVEPPAVQTEVASLIHWRAMAAAPASEPLLAALADALEADGGAAVSPALLAAMHRHGSALAPRVTAEIAAGAPSAALAVLEGAAPGSASLAIDPAMPPALRLAATMAATDPEPSAIRDLFGHDASTLRDQACLVAALRLSAAENGALVASLLKDYNDHAKVSGGILAGLTGLELPLLGRRIQKEDRWPVLQMLRAGLWMQGELGEPGLWGDLLLVRDDLPRTTVLLAQLHRGRVIAMDFLFNARGETPRFPVSLLEGERTLADAVDADGDAEGGDAGALPPELSLADLLVHYRWWHVLRHYLPAEGRPELWLWADSPLQRFQLDLLRDWAVVHRYRWTPALRGVDAVEE